MFRTLSVRHQNITVISLPLNNDENLAVDMFKFFGQVLVLSANLFQCRPAQSTSDGFVILRHLCERTSRNCRRKLALRERERAVGFIFPKPKLLPRPPLPALSQPDAKSMSFVICWPAICHLPFAALETFWRMITMWERSFGGGVVLRTHVVRIVTPIGTLSGLEESCPGIRRQARRTMAG